MKEYFGYNRHVYPKLRNRNLHQLGNTGGSFFTTMFRTPEFKVHGYTT